MRMHPAAINLFGIIRSSRAPRVVHRPFNQARHEHVLVGHGAAEAVASRAGASRVCRSRGPVLTKEP